MFHQLCSHAGYQFDSLRRAKLSTMMVLHHYFNEQVAQINVFSRECSFVITRADFWACQSFTRYALCDTCYRRHGDKHSHQLIFGPAPLRIPQLERQMVEYCPAPSATPSESDSDGLEPLQARATPIALSLATLDLLSWRLVYRADVDRQHP